jgi:hypothetical protein
VSPVRNSVTLIGRRYVFPIHVEVVRTKERLFSLSWLLPI